MAAVPYQVSITLAANGKPNKNMRVTASDVNAAYWVAADGSSEIVFSTVSAGYIADMIFVATGTDTTQVAVYKNSVDTGIRLVNAANGATVLGRQSQSLKLSFNPGDKFRFQQLT